jgi:HK97 gp10 family phage protein|tara:strand:- start:1431 stop:1859 length:429 start_codon:yes stop_codon:yes gene_type:complete
MTVVIEGVEDIQKLLTKIAPNHARNLMRSTVHAMAGGVAKEAKTKAPTRTGDLKKAIKTKRKKSHPDKPISAVIVEHGFNVKNDAYYWRFVEYGTGGENAQQARPFIAPAVETLRQNFNSTMVREFGKKLEKKLERERKKRF